MEPYKSSTNYHQASAYKMFDRTHTPLQMPKTLDTCKKKHVFFDSTNFKVYGRSHVFWFFLFFLIGNHSMKAEQQLPHMELQEKNHKKDYRIQKICLERTCS